MATTLDLDRVKSVIRSEIESGRFSARGLSKDAGLSRDTVYDILNDRNQNPTTKVLASIADAIGRDLSVFGLAERSELPTEAELHAALVESWDEAMRLRGGESRVRYLARAVAETLRLPPDQPPSQPDADGPPAPGDGDSPLAL